RRARHRHACAQPGRGPLGLRAGAPAQLPAVGAVGRATGGGGRGPAAAGGRGGRPARGAGAQFGSRQGRGERAPRGGPGAGGWGDPTERDPALVRADVLEDLISRKAALENYGVVLRDDLTLDETATQRHRDRIRSGRKAGATA